MIDTGTIKQKLREVFEIGTGGKNILVLGSCRCVPYINYLDRWNRSWFPNPFRIFVIEPNNYHWDEHGHNAHIESILDGLETNERILSIIQKTDIFIHEHYSHFKMFNTDKCATKNIYNFGMKAPVDISIPNFHDRFALFNDWIDCGLVTPDDYVSKGEEAMEKFCEVCMMSSFPEFAKVFRNTWREIRYFWRPNHVSAAFTLFIFRLMNDKFLHLPLTGEFWAEAGKEDLFKEPCTAVTQQDKDAYRITWG